MSRDPQISPAWFFWCVVFLNYCDTTHSTDATNSFGVWSFLTDACSGIQTVACASVPQERQESLHFRVVQNTQTRTTTRLILFRSMETTSLHAARIGSRFNLQPQASNSELNRLQPHLKDDGWAQYISPTEKIGAATFAVVSSFFRLVVLLLHKKQQNKLLFFSGEGHVCAV
jgi:hypothetical protein